ncbi:DUF4192 family protein [Puerhibacterium sp. TATVAM-FAB25]|uniref:DUF4192 family protein n=1 Tax=Puerhibacterium sp. TATVAM-FAB25 TaxID=3093699 RepID=UPI00397E0DA0
MTTATMRVRGARELLSAVPYALGYRPTACVVVVCVRDDGALGLVARAGLDDLADAPRRDAVADLLAHRAHEDGARVAFVVGYAAETGPGSDVVAAVDVLAAAVGALVPGCERWVVGERKYRSLDCADPACCPPGGSPTQELESTAVRARLVVDGWSPAASRDDLYRLGRAPEAARSLAGKAARRWERAAAEDRVGWRGASYDAWVGAARTGADALGPAALGRLAAALADVPVRDAVLLWCVPGHEDAARRTARGDAGPGLEDATAAAIASVVDAGRAAAPDPERTAAAVAVLEAVAAHAPRRLAAPALTLLAFLAWWSGDGGRAGYRLDAALAAEPGHRLARLLDAALRAGLPPGWLRRRTSGAGGGGPHHAGGGRRRTFDQGEEADLR